MENKYKNEHNDAVGSAFGDSANSGVSVTPPPYNNGKES